MNPTAPSSGRRQVLQVVTRLGLGGAETVALSLIRGLRDRYAFSVFAVRGQERGEVGDTMARELSALGVPVFSGPPVPLRAGGVVLAGWRAAQVCRHVAPDLTHLHTEIPEAAYAMMTALPGAGPRGALVRTIHNSVYWRFWPRLGYWCERRMHAAHVACVSRDAAAEFARHRQASLAGAPSPPPVVIHNGVAAAPAPTTRRRTAGPVRLLFAGRFEREKGADLLPEIVAGVRPPPDGCELVIHGRGPARRRLETLAARPPAGWRIRLLPPSARLREEMAGFDLVLIPSRCEGLPLVAIEALLAGCVVVGTAACGLREALPAAYPWIAHAGDPAAFAATLQDALDHPVAWAEAAARGRAFAQERFAPGAMLHAYAALYERALAADRTGIARA